MSDFQKSHRFTTFGNSASPEIPDFHTFRPSDSPDFQTPRAPGYSGPFRTFGISAFRNFHDIQRSRTSLASTSTCEFVLVKWAKFRQLCLYKSSFFVATPPSPLIEMSITRRPVVHRAHLRISANAERCHFLDTYPDGMWANIPNRDAHGCVWVGGVFRNLKCAMF